MTAPATCIAPSLAFLLEFLEFGSEVLRHATTDTKVIEFHVADRVVNPSNGARITDSSLHTIARMEIPAMNAAESHLP